MIRRVFVVCIGNICRSPVAGALLQQRLPDLAVHTAGTHAWVGQPAHPHMVALMAQQGLDIRSHRARQLQADGIGPDDLTLVMDHALKQHLLQIRPSLQGRVMRWAEFQHADVPDPMGQPYAVFEQVMQRLKAGAASWQKAIENTGYQSLNAAP